MHLLSCNTHHYKKFKLKDKASKHVQVSKKCKFTWNKKDVAAAAAAAAQAFGRRISSSAFYVFYGKLIIRILIKKCSMAGSNKKLNKDR
jgi:hypothetical protein